MIGGDAIGRLAVGQVQDLLTLIATVAAYVLAGPAVANPVTMQVTVVTYSLAGITSPNIVTIVAGATSYTLTMLDATLVTSARRPLFNQAAGTYWKGTV